MFLLLILVVIALGTLYYHWERRRIYKVGQEIPDGTAAKCYPGIGHALALKGNDQDRMTFFQDIGRSANKHGGLSKMWVVNKLYVVISDPVIAEVIYKNILDKDESTLRFIRTVIGNGSIFAPVNIWRPRRKILAPIFSMKNLNQFVKVFSAQSVVMTKLLNLQVGADDFSIWKYLTTYTFDSVCETTLGVRLNAQSQPDHAFLHAFDRLSQIIADRMCKPWLYPDLVFKLRPNYAEFVKERKLLYEFVDGLIKSKREELATSSDKKQSTKDGIKSFLELIIEQSGGSKGYTELELREEVLVLLMAGTDTSAVGAAYAVVMLSRYPDVQEKVFEELLDVFGNSDRPVTAEDLPKLKYLEVVVKETLRLYTPVPFTAREVHEDVKLPTGTTLVEGVSILLHIWAMHRNQDYWGDDVEEFRPERFFDGLRNPMQFQPFSYSNRNCLGYNYAMMSMKTVLANLLRRYTLLPPSNMDPSKLKDPLKVKYDIMMKDVDDYHVRLQRRGYGTNRTSIANNDST